MLKFIKNLFNSSATSNTSVPYVAPPNFVNDFSNISVSNYSDDEVETIVDTLKLYTIKPFASTESRCTKELKVVGVTYDNDDGTSRQTLIKNHKGYMFFSPYEYDDELAIGIINARGQMLGNVPKDDIERFVNFILKKQNGVIPFFIILGGEGFANYGLRIKFYNVQ